MKNISILFITLLCTAINVSAQDIIYKNNNETINAKIVEVTETVIKYKDFDYQEGPLRNISIIHVYVPVIKMAKRRFLPLIKLQKLGRRMLYLFRKGQNKSEIQSIKRIQMMPLLLTSPDMIPRQVKTKKEHLN